MKSTRMIDATQSPRRLTAELALTLAAISAGASYFGAMT